MVQREVCHPPVTVRCRCISNEIVACRGPPLEHTDVVRSTSFCSGTDAAALPAAERLALHHSASDVAVDVQVSGFGGLEKLLALGRIKRLNARSQSVVRTVLPGQSRAQIGCPHDGQDRTKPFGPMAPRARLHTELDAR